MNCKNYATICIQSIREREFDYIKKSIYTTHRYIKMRLIFVLLLFNFTILEIFGAICLEESTCEM